MFAVYAIHRLDVAEQVDHRVEQMHAKRGHATGGRFIRVESPRTIGQRESARRSGFADALADFAESSVAKSCAEFGDRGQLSPLITNAEYDLRRRYRGQRPISVGQIQCERLLDEHMFAGSRSRNDLIS